MRILFTRFPLESRFGGAEVQTLALMKGLRDLGHTVAFLGSCPILLKNNSEFGIRNSELHIGRPPVTKYDAVSFIWRQFSIKKKLHSAFRIPHFEFDAVLMLSMTEKLLLTPLLHAQGIKVIWIEHDRVGRWLTWNPWLSKLRRLSAMATTIVVSDLSKKIYEDLGFKNVIAIPNGIDATRLEPLNRKSEIVNQKSFHIGTLSRLSYDKGIDVLIEAVKDLPDVSLTIVGTGPEKEKFEAQMANRKWKMANHIIPHIDDLASFYHSLDVFVLPSREHDPFGLVAGEAMLMGVPTIVTDACGIAGYLTNEHDATIIPSGSIEELRNAILNLKNTPEKRALMGENGKTTAQELFSIDKMVERYDRILAENRH
ncbi:hypothetical protein A2881_05815 [Candidatus Peribacteria bacterium RIFCSPHIGHO2_01_FULL_55_13]|nr:MAG: hypothetical protein A2881_05815 [Candidatus Peribacteria bacterium RIFCSPHIGHO2_01_FULL_55_13]OGJ64322.1 MAG: hypothetical protein A3F36_03730 [Candidatus Peribacteria bacterium RIFCSPHIGHO2_12_FULL_55_11]